jgi:hypothetical protein
MWRIGGAILGDEKARIPNKAMDFIPRGAETLMQIRGCQSSSHKEM